LVHGGDNPGGLEKGLEVREGEVGDANAECEARILNGLEFAPGGLEVVRDELREVDQIEVCVF
jgi:hypothetical protein